MVSSRFRLAPAGKIIRYGYYCSPYVYQDDAGQYWARYFYDFIMAQLDLAPQGAGMPLLPLPARCRSVLFSDTRFGYRYSVFLPFLSLVPTFSSLQFGFNGLLYMPLRYSGQDGTFPTQ